MLTVQMQSNRAMINQELDKFNCITSDFWNSAKQN